MRDICYLCCNFTLIQIKFIFIHMIFIQYFFYYNTVNFDIKFYSKDYEKITKKYVEAAQNLTVINISKGFNDSMKVYYIEKLISNGENIGFSIIKYFNYFEEFTVELKNDLSNCNLLNAPLKELDNAKFISNTDTILPPFLSKTKKNLEKYYDSINDEYIVKQSFVDENNHVLKDEEQKFEYFIDFLHYINYDLSSTNLIMCDGLANVNFLEKYNICKAQVRSDVCRKCNLPMIQYVINPLDFQTDLQINNEESSYNIYNFGRNEMVISAFDYDFKGINIGYISNIHLEWRLKNEKIITENDLDYYLFKIANKIVSDCHSFDIDYLIISGDVTYEIVLFEKFVKFIDMAIKGRNYKFSLSRHRCIEHQFIFILGNHELWQFPNISISQIIKRYKEILKK